MTLVIALGNPLREDDGVGAAVARALEPAADLRVVVVHQLTPELADEVSRADPVVFVDARRGARAGELRTVALAPAAADHPLTHELDPPTLLYYAQALYGRAPKAWLVSITGEHFGMGDALSPRVAQAIPEAARLVRALVTRTARTSGPGGQMALTPPGSSASPRGPAVPSEPPRRSVSRPRRAGGGSRRDAGCAP